MKRWTRVDKDYLTYEECKERGTNEYYAREQELCRRLKYYENAEEQGRLVVLACKVGSEIYEIKDCTASMECSYPPSTDCGACCQFYVSECRINKLAEIGRHMDYGNFGKTVFLTKEEAEAALEKMKK